MLKNILALLIIVFIAIQFIHVEKTNPDVTREIEWDSPETRELASQACFDCHSNETTWPWYSDIAPVSLWLADHVDEGREHLNFSEWDRENEDFDEVEEVLIEGEMPLRSYRLVHSEARLSDDQVKQLLAGLEATYAGDPPVEEDGDGHGGEDHNH